MSDRFYFTDTARADLEYAGDGELTTDEADVDFDPSETETVTLETPWEEFFGTDEFVQFDATVAQPIVQPYIHDGELVRFKKDEAELRRSQAQLHNIEGTVEHPPHDRVVKAEQVRGFWSDPTYNDGQNLTLNVPANDPEAVRSAVQQGDVSVGFSGTLDWTDDADTEYDAVQRDFVYDHVAFGLENGRCPPEEGCGLHTDDVPDVHGHTFEDATRTKMTEEMSMSKFSEGDWVSWEWPPDSENQQGHSSDKSDSDSEGTATGRITTVSTEQPLSVSGTTRDPTEEGEPVYKAKHWNGGEWGNMKVAYESNLSEASQPEDFTDHALEALHSAGCTDVCSPGPCSCGLHDPFTDVSVNGEDIDLVPPEAAQNAAQQALDARDDEDVAVEGMTDHGWARAEQLASGEELSPSDIVGSSGAMAPWWSRHESHTIEGDALAGSDKDNPWEDNSYTAGKGWGGMAGYRWAIAKGNEIKRARGEDPTYSTDSTHPDGIHVEDGTWYGIAPSETADDEPKYELQNCNDVKDAYNLRNNGDYEIDTSTLVARIKRASELHDCPPEQKPWVDSGKRLASLISSATSE